MASRCVVKDLHLVGDEEEFVPEGPTGNRHGIVFEGSSEEPGTKGPLYGTIENCYVTEFSGGAITCRNSGYPVSCSMNFLTESEYVALENITCVKLSVILLKRLMISMILSSLPTKKLSASSTTK